MNKFVVLGLSILAALLFMMNGCGEFNASTLESENGVIDNSSALFLRAQGVLQESCMNCHGDGGSAISFNLSTPQEFISAGLIVPGRPRQSKLIYRLINFDSTNGNTNNMPIGGQAIDEEAYEALYSWITNMSSGQSPFQCDDQGLNLADLQGQNAKRLSIRQYRNTLVDLLSIGVGQNTARNLVSNAIGLSFLPEDSGETFRRENNIFSGEHAQAFFEIADNLAQSISDNHYNSFVNGFINLSGGSCSNPNPSNLVGACRTQFVSNFASRAFKRPLRDSSQGLSTTDGTDINEPLILAEEFNAVSSREGVERLIFRVLLSPHFLFQLEDQNLVSPNSLGSSTYALTSFAIINRLSYRFWNTMPDETLWQLALDEDLSLDGGYSRALNHVLARQDKLDDSLREYFYDWLHLGRTPQFNVNPRFGLIANNISFDQNLRAAMIEEVEELGSYITTSGGSFEELFTTNISFARQLDLLRIYNLEGQASPVSVNNGNAVRFPASQRGGILTRAALLVSGSEFANPILRGAHLRKDILCLDLGAPPNNALDEFNNTAVPHIATTREKVTIKTSGQACVGCHNLLNPLGFGFSNYNSFGMFIDEEPIFNEMNNSIDAHVRVSSSVDLSALFGPGSSAQNAMELSQIVADQDTVKACFAEKFLSYSFNRPVDSQIDGCRLDSVYTNLDSDSRLIDMLRAAALDMEFRVRKIE